MVRTRRANLRGGDTAVVIGAGGIGTAAIQGARISGAARIVAIDVSEFKRASAPRFGATHTAATASEAVDLVRELTHGVMADAVIVSPAMIGGADVGTALTLTRKGGTCVLTGLPAPMTDSIAVALQDFILMNKTLCGTVFGSCNPNCDIPLFATMYRSGQLLLDEMVTKRYALDDINDAYADLVGGRLIRGVIDFGSG
jgi:Zn-dependent alcohol dehydrogenase